MSNLDLKLTDFPYSHPGYGRKVAVVGVGSAGCRIANQLSKESKLLEHFLYVSCDDHDLAAVSKGERILVDILKTGKQSPWIVRGSATASLPEIRRNITDSGIVLVVAGLGGTIGSGIAPLVVKEAKERGAITVAILVMPFKHDKSRHFYAGTALRQIRNYASGVVIVENDEMQKDAPLIDEYADTNHKIALALNKLLGATEEHEFGIGLNNVISFVKSRFYSVLCVGESSQATEYKTAVMNAACHFSNLVDGSLASRSLVHLCTDKSISLNDLITSIGGLSRMLGDGTMKIEYGLSANSSTPTATAIIMATGFPSINFESYDPLGALKGNLDEDMDSGLSLESLLPDAERD